MTAIVGWIQGLGEYIPPTLLLLVILWIMGKINEYEGERRDS